MDKLLPVYPEINTILEDYIMKISELLGEAVEKPKKNAASSLPTAASLDDVKDVNDGEDSMDDDTDGEELSAAAQEFINQAGDLGDDLYTLTIYNYGDDWANVNPGTPVRSVIERAAEGDSDNQRVVDAYLNQSDSTIANERMISQIILNGRNGKMFAFSVGINAEPKFNPPAKSVVDGDQLAVLRRIHSMGKRYFQAATAFDDEQGFKAGYESDGATYRAGEALLDELNNPQFTKTKSISRSEADSRMRAYVKDIQDALSDPNISDFKKKIYKEKLSRVEPEYLK